MKFFSSLILCLAGFFICSYAQDSSALFDEYNFENGLSSNEIHAIAQDEDGFLWIGTVDGLNRYDGNSFTQYFKSNSGLSANNINDVVCLPHHCIAIATSNGLNFFDTRRDSFFVFKSGDTSALADFSNDFRNLCLDKTGKLLAASFTDLYLFDSSIHLLKKFPGNFTARDINKKRIVFMWGISSLPDSNVLIEFSYHWGIYNKYNSRIYNLSDRQFSQWANIVTDDFSAISCTDNYARFWFLRIRKDSLYEYNLKTNSIRSFPLFKGASNYFSYTTGMFCIDSTHLFLQLEGRGFYEMSFNQNRPQIILLNNLPPPSNYCRYCFDNKNNLWIGTYQGLYEWSRFKNQFHTTIFKNNDERKRPADVICFSPGKNNFWIGSYGNGIYKYGIRTKTIHHLEIPKIYPTDIWNIRKQTGDTLWLGTQYGLIWLAPLNNTYGSIRCTHPAILDSFAITTQFEDTHKNIWMGVGLGHGVVCYNPTKKFFYNLRQPHIFSLAISYCNHRGRI